MRLVVEKPSHKQAGLGCLGELGRLATDSEKKRPLPQSARTYVGVLYILPGLQTTSIDWVSGDGTSQTKCERLWMISLSSNPEVASRTSAHPDKCSYTAVIVIGPIRKGLVMNKPC